MPVKTALAIGVALLVVACGGEQTETVWPGEPNDTRETATPLTPGTPFVGRTVSDLDLDYYSFVVPEGGATVRIETFDGSAVTCVGISTFVWLYDDDVAGTLIWEGYSPGCKDAYGPLAAGTYYVKVEGYPAPATYAVKVTFT